MRHLTTKYLAFSAILLCLSLASSCDSVFGLKTDKEGTPVIVGSWGAISSSFTDGDGKVTNYPELPSGQYYFTLDFNEDGSYRQYSKSGSATTGTWNYYPSTRSLRQYPDGEDYYIPSKVTMSGKNRMSIFTDFLSSGTATENFVRISY